MIVRMGKHRQRRQHAADDRRLREEIARTQTTIDTVRNHFEQVTDPTLIDCYIYELNAAQLRYQFLLKCFKHLEDREYEYLV